MFNDTNNISKPDPYPLEERWRTIGTVEPDILFVVHTWESPGQENQTIRDHQRSKGNPERKSRI